MEAKGVELFQIDRGQRLLRAATVEFVEWVIRPLHAAVEEVASVGGLAVDGELGVAAVQREVGRRCGRCYRELPRAWARVPTQVDLIRLRTVGNAGERMC